MEDRRNDVDYVKNIILEQIEDSSEAIPTIYSVIEDVTQQLLEQSKVNTTCKKGCSFCCYIPIELSEAEFQYLLTGLDDKPNKTQLKRQWNGEVKGDGSWVDTTQYKTRKCSLLRNGICTVYETRPLACRTYLSASPPEHCDSKNNPKHQVQKVDLRWLWGVAYGVLMELGIDIKGDMLHAKLWKHYYYKG